MSSAAATAANKFVALFNTLPPRLTKFFARYPPGSSNDVRRNPFKPTVYTATGKWHNPVFSLRRQAELCKLARKYGVEELLPPSRKSSAEREAQRSRRAAKGIRVRGHREERTLKARYVFGRGRRREKTGLMRCYTGSRCGRQRWNVCRSLSRSGNGGVMEGVGRSGRVERRLSRCAGSDLGNRILYINAAELYFYISSITTATRRPHAINWMDSTQQRDRGPKGARDTGELRSLSLESTR
jgi:large subunit ribosomal protein L25